MASTPTKPQEAVADFRYDRAKRKNNPPAGLAPQGRIEERPKERYAYDPHLPPVLRFDPTGESDKLPDLLRKATQQKLESHEAELIAAALKNREPWLEWTGKRERKHFEVDPVALHIHERVSAKAIMAIAARQEIQRSLFADPQQAYHEAVQFYRHDIDWANRLILGDSLQVMSSLAKREAMVGQVQMIYMDPPYGINYRSNFQSTIGKVDVKDTDSDLTREPETIKAYRDTWALGVHSYLSYLRDRFISGRELLTTSGSFFVQISDENLHRVRDLLDEVFGPYNFCGLIAFSKTGLQSTATLPSVADYIIWYAKDKDHLRFRQLSRPKTPGEEGATGYTLLDEHDGQSWRSLGTAEIANLSTELHLGVFDGTPLISDGAPKDGAVAFPFQGADFLPPANNHWKTTRAGMDRLAAANRIISIGNRIEYRMYLRDFGQTPLSNIWMGLGERGFTGRKLYAVQTAAEAISRCLLMTTDPGDLVLDPTCGSGTTAYVAEQWGRRWITIDTSRVALAIARQRLLTASFDNYKLRDPEAGPSGSFFYKTVPHITLKSIAQNVALDPIFAKHEPILGQTLRDLNALLSHITAEQRTALAAKLAAKERTDGKRSVTDADRRRWLLPRPGEQWAEWEVPFDTDPDWPQPLQSALLAYRAAWRAKMDEVKAVIAASAEQEELVDQPDVVRGVTRVSGPFTVEAVLPAEMPLDSAPSPIDQLDEELDSFDLDNATGVSELAAHDPQNADAFLDTMLRLLRADGVRFFNNQQMTFARLDPLAEDVLHAEGEWLNETGEERRVAVSFGPQYGDVTARQVEDGLRLASRRGYDDIVFAGFNFDSTAQATVQDDPNPRVRAHLSLIRPDVNPGMDGLLKQTPNSQLFTVMGLPRTQLHPQPDGTWTAEMEGVDVYDPITNELHSTGASKVAAWFLDSDYDGRTFCICQAFFPDKSAWDKLAKALGNKGAVDPDAFAAFSGTVSLPFPTGPHARAAIKVIDPRGNEVMRIHDLTETGAYR